MIRIPAVVEEGFSLELVADSNPPTVIFKGTGDSQAVDPLNRFLGSLHERMQAGSTRQINVDLTDLYFMNSSCLKSFISWIHQARSDGAKYRICLQVNSRLPWQKRSLDRLRKLAPRIVHLEVLSPAEDRPRAAGNSRRP